MSHKFEITGIVSYFEEEKLMIDGLCIETYLPSEVFRDKKVKVTVEIL